MRYAIVHDGIVENVIEWDGIAKWSPPEGREVIQGETANIGDSWDGATFIAPIQEIEAVAVDVATAVLAPDFKAGSLTNEQRDEAIKLLLSRG